jgi:hypothetical protein
MPDGFCRAYLALVVDSYSRCNGLPLSAAEMLLKDSQVCTRFDESVAAHRTAFEPTEAQACLDSLGAAFACTDDAPMTTLTCKAVAPLVPVGGACKSSTFPSVECADGSYCKFGGGAACDGTCTAGSNAGEPCDLLKDQRCASSLSCDSASKTCYAPPEPGNAGAPCDEKARCAKGLYCDTGDETGAAAKGTCQARKTSGSCTSSSMCIPSLQCAGPSGSKTCSSPKHAGDSCTPGQSECDLVTFCYATHQCSATYASVGEPCGPQPQSENVPCSRGLYCDGPLGQPGTCRTIKQAGDACTGTALFECGVGDGHCDATSHQCVACPI